MNEYGLNSKSVREVRERDWGSVNADLLPVSVSESTHAFGVVCQIELGTVDAVFVVQPFGGVADALLTRVLDGL